LLSKIIQICSQNNYQYITNFEWWVLTLCLERCLGVYDSWMLYLIMILQLHLIQSANGLGLLNYEFIRIQEEGVMDLSIVLF
jgi:hypothetical protein